MNKYTNKYQIPSSRLQSWYCKDDGAYIITICSGKRRHHFGTVKNGKMELSAIRELAEKYWMETPNHFSFMELGNFVIMPNHIHGILIINKSSENINNELKSNISLQILQCKVSSQCNGNIDGTDEKNKTMANISQKAGSISTIIRSYKSVVTKNARKIDANFA